MCGFSEVICAGGQIRWVGRSGGFLGLVGGYVRWLGSSDLVQVCRVGRSGRFGLAWFGGL